MTTRERRSDRGRDQATRIITVTGSEIRLARRAAGTSIRAAAQSIGMSESMFGRIERARRPNVTVKQFSMACASVGLKFVARAYPEGSPVRDAAQVRLLGRLHDRLPAAARWRSEVPMPIVADLRAWDAQVQLGSQTIGVEAETRLVDVQALDRRIALKCRDSGVAVVILLVADTTSNRRMLAECREALRSNFPLDTRAVLAAIRAGGPLAASGIVVL